MGLLGRTGGHDRRQLPLFVRRVMDRILDGYYFKSLYVSVPR